PVEREHLLLGDREEITGLVHVSVLDELVDDRGPKALDVQRRTGREVQQLLATLRRAQRVETPPHRLSLLAHQLRVAGRAPFLHAPWFGAPGALLDHHAHDLGNDVAGLVQDHGVSDAHVLAGDLILVVQRAAAHRRAGDEHRVQRGHRRHRTGAPDVYGNVANHGLALLRWELVRDGPPRGA